jgi:O-antigen ligase
LDVRASAGGTREAVATGVAVLAAATVGILAGVSGWMALAVPIGLLIGVILFIHPVIGLFLLAGTIPVEAALMFEGASAPRLVGMAVFGAWGAQKLLRREPLSPLVAPGFVRIALLFFALACASLLWAAYPQGVERRLFLLVQLILLAVLVLDLASSWERLAWVAKVLVVAATVAALLTLEQYYIGGVRRAGAGVVGGINRTAVTLVAILPFAFYLFRSRESAFWRLLGLAYIGISAVAVAATLSRMNFMVFPLVVVIHLALMVRGRRERRRVVALGLAVVLAVSLMPMDVIRERALTIAPYISQTVEVDDLSEGQSGRGFHMRVGLEIFRDHPILGAGYQNYNPQFLTYQWQLQGAPRIWQSPRSPHSSHVGILANLGLVGFGLWMVLFGLALKYSWTSWREARDREGPQMLLSQAVAVAVVLQFIYGFYQEIHQGKIFWLVAGMALATWSLSRRPVQPESPPSDDVVSASRRMHPA